jgi:hypothetical protein
MRLWFVSELSLLMVARTAADTGVLAIPVRHALANEHAQNAYVGGGP